MTKYARLSALNQQFPQQLGKLIQQDGSMSQISPVEHSGESVRTLRAIARSAFVPMMLVGKTRQLRSIPNSGFQQRRELEVSEPEYHPANVRNLVCPTSAVYAALKFSPFIGRKS
jgi:hypothetical protein